MSKFGEGRRVRDFYIYKEKKCGNWGCIRLGYDAESVDPDVSGERCYPEGSTGPREIFFILF